MATTNFINECKNRANGNRLGKITVDGVTNPITNSDNLQKIKISGGCYVDGNIIGTIYVKSLTANFTARSSNTDLIDKTIYAQIGVKYADNSTEYINIGKYIVDKPTNEKTANLSQITAYTELINNLDNKYECSIDFSNNDVTLEDFYIDVCNQLGLTPTTTTFINSTIPVLNNPFTNGEKNRVVLQTVAKIACSWVEIDDDTNKIDLCWLSQSETPDYTFYKNDYATLEGGEIKYGPVNCLIIKNSQIDDENVTNIDQESIDLYGENSIVISEDYILYNAELRQQAITNIWNRVHGMTYVDAKLITYYGKPFLKLGAKIRIYTSETEYFDTYVLKHDFTYDGTFESVIESPALTKQEIKTKQDITLQEKLSNTEIKVNKQEQEIDAIIKTQDDQSESIAQLTIDTDDITSRVSSAETSLNTLNDTITNIRSTILEQTNEAFTMWFEETGLQGDLDDVQELLQSQNITLEEIKAYIRFGTINDTTSPYYGSPYIELGKEDANTKLRILDNRIQFLTGENETAYISNNTLYINESTVLTRQTMGTESTGFWITEVDSEGNQNTRWGGN